MRTRDPAVREDVRDTILDAALRLIERYGYKKTTMDDLAHEAGIGKGTIYLHFPSKEEVALSCMDRANLRAFELLRAIGRSNGTPAERLHRMLVARVMIRFDSVQHATHTLDELLTALRSACLQRKLQYRVKEGEIFAEVLIEGRLLGAFAVEDAIRTAETLLMATNGLMPSSLSPAELSNRAEVKEKATRIADALMHGVLRR